MSELDHELALTAEQQLALVTLDDVRRAGGGRDHLYDRARAGRIERVAPTVYRVRGAPRSPDTQLLANVLIAPGLPAASPLAPARRLQIGSASRRERVFQYWHISGVAFSLKQN